MSQQQHQQAEPLNERWTYEESGGLIFPVKPGQLWRIGTGANTHHYACLDFMSEQGHARVRQLVQAHRPTLLYCDPPWGQGLINQFRTKAGLERADYRWEDLYKRIISYVPRQDFPIWLESGRRERAKVVSEILHGYDNVRVFDVTYYHRNPSLVYYAGPAPAPVDVTGMDDADTPGAVLKCYPPGLVFDPCAGRGGTAVAAAKAGWSSLNIELSRYRMSAGLVALREVLGAQPRQLV